MKKIAIFFLPIILIITLLSCKNRENYYLGIDITGEYPNILAPVYTPKDIFEPTPNGLTFFSDNGSWMGFTIPDPSSRINGFCGPFDLQTRVWLSKSICNLFIETLDGKRVNSFEFEPIKTEYNPGRISFFSINESIIVSQELVIVSANDAILKCMATEDVKFLFKGGLDSKNTKWRVDKNRLMCEVSSGEYLVVTFPRGTEIGATSLDYEAKVPKFIDETYILISYYHNRSEYDNLSKNSSSIIKEPQKHIQADLLRWNSMIRDNMRYGLPDKFDFVFVKSLVTLMTNLFAPRDQIAHWGVVPSHSMGYFMGLWAWDSWKHAVALSCFDTDLAKEQIRAMFDFQTEEGMVADCVFADGNGNNFRNSKPPLATWAVMNIYFKEGNKAFLEEMFDKLLLYHNWWFDWRDSNKNGYCEWGSTDGTLEAAKWESGMDNAVRFDGTAMVKIDDGAWTMDQESVDLNAYLLYEAELLKSIARIIGRDADISRADRIDMLYFYDEKSGYFYDRRQSGEFVKIQGPEGWTPLWTGHATQDQADRVVRSMLDTTKFNTYLPFPTVSRQSKEFTETGYWRGPVWLDQVYFGISSLRRYGYIEEADQMTEKIFRNIYGLTSEVPIYENYQPLTGKGQKAPNFSWSAAHLIMIYKEYGKKHLRLSE